MKTKLGMCAWLFATAALCAGCLDVLGHQDRTLDPGLSSGGAGAAAGSGGATGGGGAMTCEAGAQQACYSGPADTRDVGLCKGGTQTCAADGAGFGACEGEVQPAQETCKDKADENCDGFDCALWSKVIADNATVVGVKVKLDGQGNIYLAGSFSGSLNLGGDTLISAGNDDIFLAKLDPTGKHLWSKRFGDAQGQIGPELVVTLGGEAILGGQSIGDVSFGGDILQGSGYVVKFDSSGTHLWSHGYPGKVDGAAVAKNGDVIAAGDFSGTADFGTGPIMAKGNDIYLLRLSSAGQALWVKSYGGPDSDYPTALALDAADNIFIGGKFLGSITFKQSLLSAAGGANDQEMFLVRFDPQGTDAWSKLISNANNGSFDRVGVIQPDASGNVTIGGLFTGDLTIDSMKVPKLSGAIDGFVAHFDTKGQLGWVKSPDPDVLDAVLGLAVSPDSDVAVVMTTMYDIDVGGGTLPAAGGADIVIAKLAPDGTHVWSRRFGDDQSQFCVAATSDSEGNLLLACSVSGSVNFGSGAVTPQGTGLVLAKLGL